MLRLLLLLALLTLAVGCTRRPTPEQCQEICWKFNELTFWETFEAETADFSKDEKEKARAERKVLWDEIKERAFDPGLRNCITGCKRGGELSQVDCMQKAETGAAAKLCFK